MSTAEAETAVAPVAPDGAESPAMRALSLPVPRPQPQPDAQVRPSRFSAAVRAVAGRTPGARVRPEDAVVVFGAVALALGLKALFVSAPAEQFRWLLTPTVAVTSWLTGLPFAWERGVGYVNGPLRYSIVPGCAGLTFFAAACGALICLKATRRASWSARWGWTAAALALAWLTTLAANTMRLVTALTLLRLKVEVPGLDAASVHRLLGVAIYLGALVAVVEALRGAGSWRGPFTLAAGWYVAVTLGLPAVRGQLGTLQAAAHAASVLGVLALMSATRALAAARRAAPGPAKVGAIRSRSSDLRST